MDRNTFLNIHEISKIGKVHNSYQQLQRIFTDLDEKDEFWYLPVIGDPIKVTDEISYQKARYMLGGTFYIIRR